MSAATIETITGELKEAVEQGIPMSPAMWLDKVFKLSVLLQDLDEKLILAEFKVNKQIAELIITGKSATSARALIRGSIDYVEFMKLKMRKEQVTEIIRIGKQRVRLDSWD